MPLLPSNSTIDTVTLDGNSATSWSAPVYNGQLVGNAVEYIEYDLSASIDVVGVYPTEDGFVWISVMESGIWQNDGGSTILYDPITPPGLYDGAYTPNIPYVVSSVVEDEVPIVLTLPRTYTAQRLRVTVGGFQNSQWGPQYYRGGLREVVAGMAI